MSLLQIKFIYSIARAMLIHCGQRYGIAHEQFMWDLRSEPALVEKFQQIWRTDELMVSYGKWNC